MSSLGRIRLEDSAGGELLAGHRKELVLLCYLARRGRAVPRTELAELLWGDRPEPKARHSLRQALSELRAVLGATLHADANEVRLGPDSVQLDVVQLQAHLSAGRPEEAIRIWHGDFLLGSDDLGGEAYRAWLESEREGLRRQIAWALERLHADASRQARWAEAAAWAEQWAELRPYDEVPQLELLEALHRSGRTAEALARNRVFATRLRQELGAEPSPDFLSRGEEVERSVRAAFAQAPSPGSAALFSPDLVGRDAALAELIAAWQQVRSGTSAIVLVEGDEGQGKTRLCAEFLRRLDAEHEKPFVLRARATDDVTASAQLATATSVAGESERAAGSIVARDLLAGLRGAPGLAGAPDRELAELSRLAPALRERFPHLPAPHGDDRVLPTALARVLGDVAAEAPVIVFVDDFTSADRPFQELLAAFADQLPPAGVLLLLTIETEERPTRPAVAGLYSARHARRLRLQPLDVAELEAVVASMIACPEDVRSTLARRLHDETGGNPLFATEILAALVDEGCLAPGTDGLWRLAPGANETLPLPAGMREAVRRRLDRLSGPARRALAAAAAGPERWDFAQLLALSGLPVEPLTVAVDELTARRLIRAEPPGSGTYRLSHKVVRRVVLELEGIGLSSSAAVFPAATADPVSPGSTPTGRARRQWPRGAAALLAASLIAAVGLGLLAQAVLPRDRAALPDAPLLAVGLIRDFTGADTVGLANALPEMLATNLARVPALQVVSQSRLYEIGGQLGEPVVTAATLAAAARRAGAMELIEGELYVTAAGGYRLDLRRIELASGTVLAAHRVDGENVFALVDEATSRLATDHGRFAGSLFLAEVTTQSIVAYRLYEEGLRAFYQGDWHRAQPLFRAAVSEDSLFALPLYYDILTARSLPIGSDTALELRLLRLMDRAPERERLLMRGRWALMTSDPAVLAVAETLTIRYPAEPEGHLLLGHALVVNGQRARALPHLRRVIDMDSLGLRRTSPQCRACQAFEAMVDAYYSLDSIAAAERVSREWVRLQPESAKPWIGLAHFLEYQGRTAEAQAARQKAATYNPGDPYDHVFPAMLAIRTGEFEAADALLSEQARNAPPAVQTEALWFLVISLRYQGRLREALEEARRIRASEHHNAAIALVEAQVLFEMGRYREAAATFRGIADNFPGGALNRTPSIRARHRTWWLTHTATALAAGGDTMRLASLADTIEALGAQSLLGRDRKLHHHVRGLLLYARGRHPDAAEAFRRATDWPFTLNSAYGRTNFEFASALLTLGRAQEAVRPLHLALTGPLEAGNYYLSRSELHALLGRVFEAAGQPDSAAFHYRWVIDAWRNADPQLHARRDSIRSRLAAIEQNASRRR